MVVVVMVVMRFASGGRGTTPGVEGVVVCALAD